MLRRFFSFRSFLSVMAKEFIQMRRDRLTFAMIIGIPIMQIVMFGYAVNSNPKNLPTALYVADQSVFARSIIAAIQNTGYFQIVAQPENEQAANALIERGEVQFLIQIPEDFSRRLVRGEKPALLVIADASDPAATGNALAALQGLGMGAIKREMKGALSYLQSNTPAYELILHRAYNPESVSSHFIVPGLLGVVLTLTMVIITALAMTRERERGTMEFLLAMPIRPSEVITGKIVPYIFMGYVQVLVILGAAKLLFDVPMVGDFGLLSLALIVFIATNLALGFAISSLAKTQLQALQMAIFIFLPSVLLSGFMFPFFGMPGWAQIIGEGLPITHFLRIVRGIMLKGNGFMEIAHELSLLCLILLILWMIALRFYRRTLD